MNFTGNSSCCKIRTLKSFRHTKKEHRLIEILSLLWYRGVYGEDPPK